MDAVRYVLAFSVVVAHFNYLCGFDIPWPVSSSTGVGGFFALSGFLIYRNFEQRPIIRHYVLSRTLRILPPYVLIVVLCAFLLAPFSTLPAREYFLDPGWWKYLASNLLFLNFLAPDIPGVFSGPEFSRKRVVMDYESGMVFIFERTSCGSFDPSSSQESPFFFMDFYCRHSSFNRIFSIV